MTAAGPAQRERTQAITDRLGVLLLVLAVGVQALAGWPEVALGPTSVHDGTLHHALALRLIEAVQAGENPIDAWVSSSSLGSPVWRSYQPLTHWISALAVALGSPFASSGAVFGFLTWLVLCLHPLAFFGGARLLGVGRFGAGVAALLCLAPVAAGNLNAFGQGFGAYVWSGSGLTTQMWAVPLFVLALGATSAALRGDGSRTRAALLIGATALCHLIFGYAAALSAVLLTVLLRARLARLVLIGGAVFLLAAFLVVPAVLDGPYVNHSVWEPVWKWTSHGAPTLVGLLLRGELFDAGRAPLMSLLLAGSAGLAVLRWSGPGRTTLALTVLWLLLAFGRQTWGALLPTALVHEHIHLHRFVAVFQVCAVLLIGAGADALLKELSRRPRASLLVGALLTLATVPILRERVQSARVNAELGLQHRLAREAELDDARGIFGALDEAMGSAPGRVHAGFAARWGKEFLIGTAPAYHEVLLRGLDATSHLWHSMSIPSDGLLLIDDGSDEQLARFGVRYVLSNQRQTGVGRELARSGRFSLREVPGGGYFSVQREPPVCGAEDPAGRLQCARDWLARPLRPGGEVLSESRDGAEHDALVRVDEPASVVFRSTFHPGWRAWVDGVRAPTRMVTPGFLAVDVAAGRHDVRLRYGSGPGKTALLLLGWLAFAGFTIGERRGLVERLEEQLHAAANLGRAAVRGWGAAERGAAWAARGGGRGPLMLSVALAVLALAPLFRGELVLGHDATEYPTRLAELHENLRHGILLPVWAPDLGAGFGQPMFGFVPPLLILLAEAFHLVGFGLAASLQGALIALALAGALAMYGLGRRVGGPTGGLLATAAFTFGTYFQVELYVRSAMMEFSGLALLPVALLLLLRTLERPGPGRLVAASCALAGVALSHNAVLLMAAPALAGFVALVALARRDGQALLRGVAAGALGLGLSAWFWLPALVEAPFTHAHRLLENATRWEGHFVSAGQLWSGTWGYGLSVPGVQDAMSFAIGPLTLLLAGLGAAAVVRSAAARRSAGGGSGGGESIAGVLVLVSLAICAVAALMTVPLSAPAWARLGLLQFLQFPWRFLVLVSVFLPLVVAAAARWTSALPGPWRRLAVVGMASALVVPGLMRLSGPSTRALGPDEFTPATIAREGLETTTFREFEPVWVTAPRPWQPERLTVVRGDASVRTVSMRPTRQRFEVDATTPSRLELATYYFPGWQVLVDGEPVALSWVESGGTPHFDVPSGRSEVEARFRLTPVRRGTRALSLLTLLALAGWLAMASKKARATGSSSRAGGADATRGPAPGAAGLGARPSWRRPEALIPLGITLLALVGILASDEPLPSASPDAESAALAHARLGDQLLAEGRPDLAEREFRAALAVQPREDAWVGLGLVALNAGRLEEAEQAFLEATVLAPSSYAAWIDLGIARSRQGEHREALEPFTRALELQPDSANARHNLALTWRELGDEARAREFEPQRTAPPTPP